jgi:hypothetical protein
MYVSKILATVFQYCVSMHPPFDSDTKKSDVIYKGNVSSV